MKKLYFPAIFLFFSFLLFSEELTIPPEMYWFINELTRNSSNNPIIQPEDSVSILEYNTTITNVSKYVLPIFTRWNYSATIGCSLKNGYIAKKVNNKIQLIDKYNGEDPIGMIVFKKNMSQLYYEQNGTSCFLLEAYWLTDSILVAVGQYPSYEQNENEKTKIFFYKYEFLDKNIKRTEYIYKNSFKYSDLPDKNYWIKLRPDYFADPPFGNNAN